MTPQEIFEYKMKWQPGHLVALHSDYADRGKLWCRKNLERHQWAFDSYTAPYEHTFRFQHPHHAREFADAWNTIIVME